jgi:hypothetical protein
MAVRRTTVMAHHLMTMVLSMRRRLRTALSQSVDTSAIIVPEHSFHEGMLSRGRRVRAQDRVIASITSITSIPLDPPGAARQQSADSLGESEGDATPVSTRDRIGQRARRPGLRETAGGELFPKPLKNDDCRPRAVGSGMGCRFIASACVSACDRPPGASFLGREKFAGAARARESRERSARARVQVTEARGAR